MQRKATKLGRQSADQLRLKRTRKRKFGKRSPGSCGAGKGARCHRLCTRFLARKVLLPRAPEGPGIRLRCEIRGEPGNTVFSGRRNPRLAAGLPILKTEKALLDRSGNSEDKDGNGSPS